MWWSVKELFNSEFLAFFTRLSTKIWWLTSSNKITESLKKKVQGGDTTMVQYEDQEIEIDSPYSLSRFHSFTRTCVSVCVCFYASLVHV